MPCASNNYLQTAPINLITKKGLNPIFCYFASKPLFLEFRISKSLRVWTHISGVTPWERGDTDINYGFSIVFADEV
jgi:hypothetical protein